MGLLDFGGAAAYGTSGDPLGSAMKGYDFGLKQAQVNALRGVDLSNPSSVDNAITASIHAGSIDQANALLGLNATRSLYSSILPMVEQRLQGAQQTSQPSATPPDANSPEFAQAHANIMDQAKQAIAALQAAPQEQRPAMAAQLKQHFLGLGVPEGAINAELSDLSDQGLAKVAQHYDDHAAWMQNGQGQPAPTSPNGYDWATKLMQDPTMNDPYVLAAMKRVGFDLEPYMQRAQQIAMPEITKQAELKYAGPIAEAGVPAKIAESYGSEAAKATYAGATKAAEEAAAAPFHPVEVTLGDGSKVPGVMDGKGSVKLVQVENGAPGNTTGGGASGKPAPTLGQGTGAASYSKGQADALSTQQTADAALYNPALLDQQLGKEAVNAISQLKFDPSTPVKMRAANVLRALPPAMLQAVGLNPQQIDQYAQTGAVFDQLMNRVVLTLAKQTLPSRYSQNELMLVKKAEGQLDTPEAKAALTAGLQVALANRNISLSKFAAGYKPSGSPNVGDYQQAWQNSTAGQAGIFSDPVWRSISIGGKPAVQTFDYKGKTYLAVLPGLGKPMIEPAN